MSPQFHISRVIDDAEEIIVLEDDEARHLARVMRLGEGGEAQLFDTAGRRFRVRIESVSGRVVAARILERLGAIEWRRRPLTLAVSLIRNEPMNWLIQKATELGVERLAPFISARTQAIDAKAEAARLKRWERVSLAACKQCGRPAPLELGPVRPFDEVLREWAAAPLALIAWEGEESLDLTRSLRGNSEDLKSGAAAAIAIGPEGGFTPEEINQACEGGWTPVNLGPLILRTETAALAAAAIILAMDDK